MDSTYLFRTQKNLTDWENEPDVMTLKTDLENSKSAHDSQVSKINKWNDLLNVSGSAKIPKVKGKSSVQPKLIRRQAEWRYSALSEPFLGSQKLFKVAPVTYEDVAAANQNELVLNWQFRTKLNKVKLIDDYVRAVVDDGTCIVRLGWCRKTKEVTEQVPVWSYYPIGPMDQQYVQQLQQAAQLQQEDPRTYNESVPEELKAAVGMLSESGTPTIAVLQGYQPTKVEKVLENNPTVEILNPANVYIDPSCNGDLDKALFVIVSFETNKAELKKYSGRYKNLDMINWEGNSILSQPDHETTTPDSFTFKDAIRKKVVAYEYWGYYDINGDGDLQPIVATWVGDVMIRLELNPYPDEKLPFVLVPYSPIKRSLYGEPDAEILEDNQRILGAVSRGMIDLLGKSANGQQGFAKGMLDPLNRRKFDNGQDYEFNPGTHPANGLIEHKYPEVPQTALVMLNLQNQEAEAMTGVKSFSGGLSGNAYGDVAAGVKGMIDAAGKREMAILRRLAKGMSEIGNKIVAMNAEFLSDQEVIRVTNEQYIHVNREDLKGNFDLEVDISTAEVDNTKAQDLGFMLQTLGPNMDSSISMLILSEIASLKRMPALAHQLKNWKPQPDPMQEQMKQLELARLQKEVEKLDSEIQLNNAKAHGELLDTQEQVTGIKHKRDMDRQQAQAEGNQKLEITKSLTKSRKEGEASPNIEAALGYNALSKQL